MNLNTQTLPLGIGNVTASSLNGVNAQEIKDVSGNNLQTPGLTDYKIENKTNLPLRLIIQEGGEYKTIILQKGEVYTVKDNAVIADLAYKWEY